MPCAPAWKATLASWNDCARHGRMAHWRSRIAPAGARAPPAWIAVSTPSGSPPTSRWKAVAYPYEASSLHDRRDHRRPQARAMVTDPNCR
jgi:hypothetical protein